MSLAPPIPGTAETQDQGPSPEQIEAAKQILIAANAQAASPQETAPEPVEVDKDALIKQLQAQVAATGSAPVGETTDQKIARLEAQVTALTTAQGSVPALTHPLAITDEQIGWNNIEPGIKWAVRQGLLKAEDLGEHIAKLFIEHDGPKKAVSAVDALTSLV